jgi:uncharacterized membrane protein
MADDGKRELDRAFEDLEAEVPDRVSRAIRWLREPKARKVRIPLGVLFLAGGLMWFLPVVGIEMLPIGLLLIAQDVPFLRKPVGRGILWLDAKWRALRRWWEARAAWERAHTAPPGWSYDPSSWSQRLPLVGAALVGFAIATYLALFQWKVVDGVWEPFFGEGSRRILTSGVSRILPIPDAALGALGYLADAVGGIVGGRGRWRRMPWIVVLFGIAVGPLGAVSILLVILQPVLYDSWCTLCLASAVVSVVMIGPAMDEVLASLQHLARERRAGKSLWRSFWGLRTDRRPRALPSEA